MLPSCWLNPTVPADSCALLSFGPCKLSSRTAKQGAPTSAIAVSPLWGNQPLSDRTGGLLHRRELVLSTVGLVKALWLERLYMGPRATAVVLLSGDAVSIKLPSK